MRGAHLSEHLGSVGRATGMLGRETAPSLEAGVYKNHRSLCRTPLVFSECPLSLGLVGRPLTKSCGRSQLIWTLLLPLLGVTPRFQWLLAALPAQMIYICLLTSVGDPMVFVMKSG